MTEEIKILCVDDEKNVLKALRRLFMDDDYDIITADSGEEGLQALKDEGSVQIIISDYRMPGMDGVEFLKQVYEHYPDTIRIVLSGYADTAAVVGAINEGQIYKFIPKPWNDDELKVTIDKAIETHFLARKNRALTEELRDSNDELRHLNENLEELVEDRTIELSFQIKALERSQHIIDTMPVGVLGMTMDGTIVQSNEASGKICGIESASLISQNVFDILPGQLTSYIKRLPHEKCAKEKVDIAGVQIDILGSILKGDEGQNGMVVILINDD